MPWQVMASSVAGSSHSRHGMPCQDAFSWKELAGGRVAVAVADGAGSAECGRQGAEIAVQSAICTLAQEPGVAPKTSNEALYSALGDARSAIANAAELAGLSIKSFACTCILVISGADETVALQVGDGAVVLDNLEGLVALTTPPKAEYANETAFLTSDDWLSVAQFAHMRGETHHICALTDGLQRLALEFPACTPHVGFFRPLLTFANSRPNDGNSQLEAFLKSPRLSDRTDDDVTLVIASAIPK